MAKSSSDFIVIILAVLFVAGVGFALGNDAFQSSKTIKYIDFNELDLLNVSGYEVEEQSTYNSLVISEGIDTSIAPQFFLLDFGEDVNLSNVDEYEIEVKFSFDNVVAGDGIQMLLTYDDQLESVLNMSYDPSLEEELVRGDILRNANSGNPVQLMEEFFGRFESQDDLTIKLKFNTETGYLVKVANSEGASLTSTAFSMFEELPDDSEDESFDPLTNARLGLYLFDTIDTTNTISENSSWSIDYIKLTYIADESE